MNNYKKLSGYSDKSRIILKMAVFLICVFTVLLLSEADNPERHTPVVKAVEKILPSVVNISSPENSEDNRADTLGSGVIISPNGLVLTNSHVVSGAVSVNATLWDGRKVPAYVISDDSANDLALIKLENAEKNLYPVEFSEPGDLLLGETVIAAGNPYGLGSSVSKGILSAIRRKIVYRDKTVFSDILQTDTPIYPGNSGGPLANIEGKLIGISTGVHKYAPGIGFAIPLKRVENVLARWLTPERFNNAYMGFIPAVRTHKGKPEIYVYSVRKDSPAWEAGMRGGELISKFNGKPVKSLFGLVKKLYRLKGDSRVNISAKEAEYRIKLRPYVIPDGIKAAEMLLGMRLEKLNRNIKKALGYESMDGLLLTEPFAGGKVKRGALLISLDGIAIRSAEELARALKQRKQGDTLDATFCFKTEDGLMRRKKIKLNLR